MKKADYILWACVVVLGTMQGLEMGRSLRMQEQIKFHSDLLDQSADQYHSDKDLRKTWGERWEARLDRLEDRAKKLESRLPGRRIGDAP